MMDEFEYKGKWWLPAAEDNRIDGTLAYAPADGAILELSGAFGDLSRLLVSGQLSAPRIILGTTASGQDMTLLNCAQKRRDPSGAYPTSSYRVHMAFVGSHFPRYDDIAFESLLVQYSHLDAWAGVRYLEATDEAGATKISYRRPDQTVAHLDGGLRVEVLSVGSEQWEGSPPTRVTLERGARIKIGLRQQGHFDEFLKPIRLIQIFLSLGVGTAVHPLKVTGSRQEMLEDSLVPPSVEVFYEPPLAAPPRRRLFSSDMTFTLANLSGRLEPFMNNWFKSAELLGPVPNLYLAALAEAGIFAEHRFLTLAQAVESFHRRRHGGEYLSAQAYKPTLDALVAAIPGGISEEHRDALQTRLKYGYQYALRKRLADLLNAHQPVLSDVISDPKAFIRRVVNTRNYLTHYDEDDKQGAATDGLELHRLATDLRTLIEVCLLSEIGFTSEEIRKQVDATSSRRVAEPIEYE